MARLSSGNLVNLIEKDHSGRLHALNRRSCDLVHIDKALFFFLHEVFGSFVHAHLSSLDTALKEIAEHVFHVNAHLFDALWSRELDDRKILLAYFNLNQTIVEFSTAKLGTKLLASPLKLIISSSSLNLCRITHFIGGSGIEIIEPRGRPGWGKKDIEDSLFDVQFSFVGNFVALLLPRHVNGYLGQVADHTFHVASDITNFCKLRRLDLEKRRVGHAR